MSRKTFHYFCHFFKLKDIRSLGCGKDEVSAATYRIYLDLCVVRKYEIVSYHLLSELDHLYLKARRKSEDEEEIVIPILATKTFSFHEMEKFQAAFSGDSIKLAICDTSSTIMYYNLSRS